MKKILLALFILFPLVSCNQNHNKYENTSYWVYQEIDKENPADTFFVGATAATLKSTGGKMNMPIDDEYNRNRFKIQVDNEAGIYTKNTRFFAPYYSQTILETYTSLREEDREQYFAVAYQDVKESFRYYLEHFNQGRPIVLAGFSQGSDMALRLLKDFFHQEKYANLLVACYAPGFLIDDNYLASLPNGIHFATGEKDNKSIIGFECERADITGTIIVPEGKKTHSINPLTWTSDTNYASETLNKGAKFFTSKGEEDPKDGTTQFDAQINEKRGTINVTNVDSEFYNCYPFADGVYHIYDWQFYYTNLQENVVTRTNNWLNN